MILLIIYIRHYITCGGIIFQQSTKAFMLDKMLEFINVSYIYDAFLLRNCLYIIHYPSSYTKSIPKLNKGVIFIH